MEYSATAQEAAACRHMQTSETNSCCRRSCNSTRHRQGALPPPRRGTPWRASAVASVHCAEQARTQVIRPSQALCSPLTAHDCEVLCQALKWHAPKAGLAGKKLCNNRRCAQEEALLTTQLCSHCIVLARPCRCGSMDGEGKGAAFGPFYLG